MKTFFFSRIGHTAETGHMTQARSWQASTNPENKKQTRVARVPTPVCAYGKNAILYTAEPPHRTALVCYNQPRHRPGDEDSTSCLMQIAMHKKRCYLGAQSKDFFRFFLRLVSLQRHHMPISFEVPVVLAVVAFLVLNVRLLRYAIQRVWRRFLLHQEKKKQEQGCNQAGIRIPQQCRYVDKHLRGIQPFLLTA